MKMNDRPTKEESRLPKCMTVRQAEDITKERQVKFLEETISELESFKQQVINGEVFVEDATMNCERTAASKEEIGGNNIYINIDYQTVEQNIK